MELQIDLSKDAIAEFEKLSEDCKVPVKKLVELILENFLGTGGKTHYGTAREGSYVVIAWPIEAGYVVVNVKPEEVSK